MAKKTAILIYCTQEEREKIKLAAKRERRTITGFVMKAVTNRFAVEDYLRERIKHTPDLKHADISQDSDRGRPTFVT